MKNMRTELGFGVSITKVEDDEIIAHVLDNDIEGLRQQIGFKRKGGMRHDN